MFEERIVIPFEHTNEIQFILMISGVYIICFSILLSIEYRILCIVSKKECGDGEMAVEYKYRQYIL